MRITELRAGVKLIHSPIHKDERGWLQETYHYGQWTPHIDDAQIEQVNLSHNRKGSLRGLHLQYARPQGKLLRCLTGAIRDVMVDVRPSSPTLGLVQTVVLKSEDGDALWIPEGFAHGFLALRDDTLLQYMLSRPHHPESSVTLRWDAPELAIDWGLEDVGGKDAIIVSAKDQKGLEYSEVIALLFSHQKSNRTS